MAQREREAQDDDAQDFLMAHDGEEALEWIAHRGAGEPNPAVNPLDIIMLNVDGLAVVRQLKVHPKLRVSPVLILTTSSNAPDPKTAYLCGVHVDTVKPVDFPKFAEVARSRSTGLSGIPFRIDPLCVCAATVPTAQRRGSCCARLLPG